MKKRTEPFMTVVILCVLITEASERFSYYGLRAILILYFTNSLQFDESTSIALFSFTTCLAYASPIIGALLADGRIGRYRTILYFMLIYIVGLIILTYGALFVSDVNVTSKRMYTFLGLILCCLGTGGIKPCVSAFGADQISSSKERQCNAITANHCNSNNNNNVSEYDEPNNEEMLFLTQTNENNKINQIDNNFGDEDNNKADDENVRLFFSYFYFCINVGAVASIITIPKIKASFGFGIAFLTQTIFLLFAILAFISKSQEYVHNNVPGDDDNSSIITTFYFIFTLAVQQLKEIAHPSVFARNNMSSPKFESARIDADSDNDCFNVRLSVGDAMIEPGESEISSHKCGSMSPNSDAVFISTDMRNNHNLYQKSQQLHIIDTKQQQLDDAAQVLHILPILALLPIFWMLYDQQGSVWTLQATRMYLPFNMQPEQMNMINPLEIMIFIPLFENNIYPFLENKCRIKVTPLERMSWGMFLCAVSFFISGFLESNMQHSEFMNNGKVNVLWQLPQITILAVAEIFVSITGLEFAYSTSPKRLKAIIMALYLLTTAIGNFFGGVLYSSIFKSWNMSVVMHVCGMLMIINLGIFCLVARWWKKCENRNQLHKKKGNGRSDRSKSTNKGKIDDIEMIVAKE